jgi:hypothetical protein
MSYYIAFIVALGIEYVPQLFCQQSFFIAHLAMFGFIYKTSVAGYRAAIKRF